MGTLFWKRVSLSFARAFATTFVLGLVGVVESVSGEGGAFDLSAGRAAAVALVVGGVTAGLRAVQVLFTNLETPPPA